MVFLADLVSKDLSEKVAKLLGLSVEYPQVDIFSDGEKRVRVSQGVGGEDVILFKSLSSPVDSNILEFCFLIDALKRTGAKKVIGVVPYLGYSRGDHVFRSGEAVPVSVVIKAFEAAGLDEIFIFDPHSVKIQEMFAIKAHSLSAIPIFAGKIKSLGLKTQNITIVSPDMGGIRRAKILAGELGGGQVAVVEKDRDLETGELSSKKIEGRINRYCFIIDDLISTGGTVAKAAALLKQGHADKVYCFATHAVFSDKSKSVLAASEFEKVFVTDSIFLPDEKKFAKLEILSLAEEIAKNLK